MNIKMMAISKKVHDKNSDLNQNDECQNRSNIERSGNHLDRTTISIKVHVTKVLQSPKVDLKITSKNGYFRNKYLSQSYVIWSKPAVHED